MKKILLPTDFSKNAWNALFTALKLFDKQVCEFLILHAYQPELGNMLADGGEKQLWALYEDLKKESEAQMAEVTGYLEREYHNPHHSFRSLCRQGELTRAIREVLESETIDMIAMGTKGATGAKRVFMGSNTVRVIRAVRHRPILAVPESYDLQRVHNVIFPTDYMQSFEPFELQPLLELLKEWKARLHVVYAAVEFRLNPTQEAHKKQLETLLQEVRHRFEEVPLGKNVSSTLTRYSEESDADLMALVYHKHPFFESLTREPVLKRVAFESELPLLILPQLG